MVPFVRKIVAKAGQKQPNLFTLGILDIILIGACLLQSNRPL